MTAKYHGWKVVKNEFGDVVARHSPCVTILCKAEEGKWFYSVVRQIEEETGIDASCFGDPDYLSADFPVKDSDEKEELLSAYRRAKKQKKERL